MTNKTYDILKLVSLIAVPAATFEAALLKIWNVPYTAEITATLAAVDALLGSLVTVLKSQYDKASTDGIEG